MSSTHSRMAASRLVANLAVGCALVTSAMAAMAGHVDVVQATSDGTPTFMRGDLGQVTQALTHGASLSAIERAVRPALASALAPLHLDAADLKLRLHNMDAAGNHHLRFDMMHNGLRVVGGDMVVHVDGKGRIFALNGNGRGIPATLGARDVGESAVHPTLMADARFAGMETTAPTKVYLVTPQGSVHLAYESVVTGKRGQDPVRDKVYVDAASGAIVAVHPQIYFAENRKIYSANNGTSLPGTLKRTEGQAATSDTDVNSAYDGTGDTYEAYKKFWNRDSYNNAGATLTSSVHYSTNYCNAYWDGSTQMVYGDGDPSQNCAPLARSVDVTGHELTHAVTQFESNLTYSGESGGLNEAMSDIFGAFTEAYVDGGKTGTLQVSQNTWTVGEVIMPPGLRFMYDPAKDGSSLDYWTTSAGNVDVHYSSGIANLAFYLMSQGGKHPRGKSNIQVTGIGMDKAIRVMYEANTNILTSSSNFLAAGNASVQAAVNLGYSLADQISVANAWQAVGVNVPTPGGGCGNNCPPPPGDTTLTNGVALTGQSGATGAQAFYKIVVPSGQTSLVFNMSGGTGDADMYTKLGAHPTLTTYDCRPYVSGNTETCTVTNPAAGTYYVMLNGYAAYSGVSLKATYSGSQGGGDPYLTNGQAITVSGAAGSNQYWRVTTPAGKALTIALSGGTGDADLYTRFGSRPTTSTYLCRPYLTGNNETCTVSSTSAGDYYIMLNGYSAYSGASLKASF